MIQDWIAYVYYPAFRVIETHHFTAENEQVAIRFLEFVVSSRTGPTGGARFRLTRTGGPEDDSMDACRTWLRLFPEFTG